MYVSLTCRRIVASLALCGALVLTACADASAPEGTTPGATAARGTYDGVKATRKKDSGPRQRAAAAG